MNLREEMPETYAFIESCREAFGKDAVNPMIKLGMEGAETFHAVENGIEIGTRARPAEKFVSGDQMAIRVDALPSMPHRNSSRRRS